MTPGYLEILNDSLDIVEDDFLVDFFVTVGICAEEDAFV